MFAVSSSSSHTGIDSVWMLRPYFFLYTYYYAMSWPFSSALKGRCHGSSSTSTPASALRDELCRHLLKWPFCLLLCYARMPHSLIFTGTLLIYIKYIILHRVFSQGEFWQSLLLELLVVFQNNSTYLPESIYSNFSVTRGPALGEKNVL